MVRGIGEVGERGGKEGKGEEGEMVKGNGGSRRKGIRGLKGEMGGDMVRGNRVRLRKRWKVGKVGKGNEEGFEGRGE